MQSTQWSIYTARADWNRENVTEAFAKKLYQECIKLHIPASLFCGITIVKDFNGCQEEQLHD